jgi:thiosulfate dehydrogenase [quinone] large subunit
MLLPLRAFLAVTFCYAGLRKLADPSYLDPHSASSVVGQMQSLRHTSPIGPLLGLSLHQPTLVGLLIAFGELAVGVGMVLGLWTRLAAAGGLVLSLSFFLTVSWTTTPYFYGSDIVFVFAWTAILAFGSAGVLSLDAYLAERARRLAGLGPAPISVVLDTDVVRHLCPERAACRLQAGGACFAASQCPVMPTAARRRQFERADLGLRRLLLRTRAAAVAGVAVLATAAATAFTARLAGAASANSQAIGERTRRRRTGHSSGQGARHHHKRAQQQTRAHAPATKTPPGVALVKASTLPVGQAQQFRDPRSNDPAWLVHPSASQFVAFSAVCTHAGCTVGFDQSSMHFVCPCHGGTYDARSGRVLAGPPPSPLPHIPVHLYHGEIRVD